MGCNSSIDIHLTDEFEIVSKGKTPVRERVFCPVDVL
jgi:hypothetical protein